MDIVSSADLHHTIWYLLVSGNALLLYSWFHYRYQFKEIHANGRVPNEELFYTYFGR